MKIKEILFVSVTIFTVTTYAQSYEVTTSSGSYTTISSSTSLNGTAPWDDPEYRIPIGFDFQFFSTTINQIYINDAGFGAELTPGPGDTGTTSILIPYYADIADRGYDDNNEDATTGSLSNISYLLEGTLGDRILKIEWNNVGFLSDILADNISTDFTNFQLWLYEGSNVIEIHFGPNSIVQPELAFDGDSGASVSLISEINLLTEQISGTAVTLSGNPTNPTVSDSDPNENFFNGVIPNGTIYRFTPTTLSISESKTKNLFKAYPVPAEDFLYIDGTSSPQEYVIINTLGSILEKGKINGSNKIDIQNYPTGMYSILISENHLIRFAKK